MLSPSFTQTPTSIGEDGVVEGYASLFGEVDQARDMVMAGAFAASLRTRGVRRIPMLFQHDPAEPIGVWLELREDWRGLYARGRLIPEVVRARELLALLKAGATDGLSIGFRTVLEAEMRKGRHLANPPLIPLTRSNTTREKNNFLKGAARWLFAAARRGGPAGTFLSALDALSWLDTDRYYIDAYQDPPSTFAELQQAVAVRKLGYDIHLVVERSSALKWGIPSDLVDGPENLVRIPTLKHWEINRWFETENYGGVTPRQYLKDKDWTDRARVGRDALIEAEVLKP